MFIMSEFKVIETQEELDKVIGERLARQKETVEKQYKNQYADYDQLKTRNAELETKVGELETAFAEIKTSSADHDRQVNELNAKIAGYETASMRTRIALQNGIPYDLAGRLIGEDEASVAEDAKRLAELMGRKEPLAPLKGNEPKMEGKDGAYKSLLDNLNLEGE